MTRSVLFTVANANQAANAVPVVEQLLERGVGGRVMVLDPVYHQGAGPVVARAAGRLSSFEAPARPLATPFARLSMTERWQAVRDRGAELIAAAGDHDGVVAGMDGAFERLVLKRYRDRKRFTAILWDALIRRQPGLLQTGGATRPADLAWHAGEWLHFAGRRTLLRAAARLGADAYVPGLAGHTPVDTIYTAGRFVTEAFRSQGVASPIETTGIPRFAPLSRVERQDGSVERRRVVYLTGSFAWHEWDALDRSQDVDLDALAQALPRWGWRLTIRIHPREDATRYARFAGRSGVTLSSAADLPLWDELARAGVVLTAMSTAGLEALALGRPLIVYLGAFPHGLRDITLGAHPSIPVARALDELHARLEAIGDLDPGSQARVLADFVDPGTADSAQRIADSIVRHL